MTHRDLNFSDQVRLIQLAVGVPVTGQTSNTNARAMTALTGLSGNQMWKMSTEQFLDHVKNNPDLMAKAQQNMANAGPQHQHLVNAFGGSAAMAAATINPAQATASNPGIVQAIQQPTVAPAPQTATTTTTVTSDPAEAPPTVVQQPAQVAPDPALLYKQALLSIDPTTGVGVNDVTGIDNPDSEPFKNVPVAALEQATKENFTTDMLLTYDQLSQDQGGAFTSVLQAILKALGFNVDITGERDAKTVQAVEDAGELLGNREAIYEAVDALGDETIKIGPNEDGLFIEVDGNVMVFDRAAVIASGGDLKQLIEGTPGPLEALTEEQQNKIIDAAGVDRDAITIPAAKGTEPEAGAGPDGADDPDAEVAVNQSSLLSPEATKLAIAGAGITGALALLRSNVRAAGEGIRDGIFSLRNAGVQRQAADAAAILAAERGGLTAAKEAAESRLARVETRIASTVPPKTRLERIFGLSEERRVAFAKASEMRTNAQAAVERASFTETDADGNVHPRKATADELTDIDTRRTAAIRGAVDDIAKPSRVRGFLNRFVPNLRTATEANTANLETRIYRQAAASDARLINTAESVRAARAAELAPAPAPTARTRTAAVGNAIISPGETLRTARQGSLRLAGYGLRGTFVGLPKAGLRALFGSKGRIFSTVLLGTAVTAHMAGAEELGDKSVHELRLEEAQAHFGADSPEYAEYASIYAEWLEVNDLTNEVDASLISLATPVMAVSGLARFGSEHSAARKFESFYAENGVSDEMRQMLTPTMKVPLSLSGNIQSWATGNLIDMEVVAPLAGLQEHVKVYADAGAALDQAEKAITDFASEYEGEGEPQIPEDLLATYGDAQIALLNAEDAYNIAFADLRSSPEDFNALLAIVPSEDLFEMLAVSADLMSAEQFAMLPPHVGEALQELITASNTDENAHSSMDTFLSSNDHWIFGFGDPEAVETAKTAVLSDMDSFRDAVRIAVSEPFSNATSYDSAADGYDVTAEAVETAPRLELDIPSTASVMAEFEASTGQSNPGPSEGSYAADVDESEPLAYSVVAYEDGLPPFDLQSAALSIGDAAILHNKEAAARSPQLSAAIHGAVMALPEANRAAFIESALGFYNGPDAAATFSNDFYYEGLGMDVPADAPDPEVVTAFYADTMAEIKAELDASLVASAELPQIHAFSAEDVIDDGHRLPPVQPFSDTESPREVVEAYNAAWETNPTGMAGVIMEAISAIVANITGQEGFDNYRTAINSYYADPTISNTRPEGEAEAAKAAVDAAGRDAGFIADVDVVASADMQPEGYKAGLSS